MKKTTIAPIIAVICLAITSLTGIHISDSLQADIVDWVYVGCALGLSIYGIFKSHRKDDK